MNTELSSGQVYVDALGNTTTYEAYLSSQFPGISFTVTTKADSKFKIVGAASVAAKVTRDACVDGWTFEELIEEDDNAVRNAQKENWNREFGSGYPSGLLLKSRGLLLCLTKLQIQRLKVG
jgi:ribonuclease H2 subunit A